MFSKILKLTAIAVAVVLLFGISSITSAQKPDSLKNRIFPYVKSLSREGVGKGRLSARQKKDIQVVSPIINDWAKEHLRTKIDFVVPRELEEGVRTGDFSSFASLVAKRFLQWEKAQPPYRVKVWQGRRLSDKEAKEAAKAERIADPVSLIGWIIAINETAEEVSSVINDLIDGLCGPDEETAETPEGELPGGITLRRESYLHVPWRGWVWGDNNQLFEAQYIVRVNGGVVDELRVRFRIDLSGTGFDRLDYPIETTGDTITLIRGTRYQQIHEIVAHNVSFLHIAVRGRVHYGMDGAMTDAGLVPSGTATKNGVSVEFGEGDSIWKYGTSI